MRTDRLNYFAIITRYCQEIEKAEYAVNFYDRCIFNSFRACFLHYSHDICSNSPIFACLRTFFKKTGENAPDAS